MSPYLIVYGVLLILATISFIKKRDYNIVFIVSAAALTLFLALRYGQGTDYFSYMRLYEEAPGGLIPYKDFWGKNENIEFGWKLLEAAFQAVKAPFWVFMGVIGTASMLLLHRFVVKCCCGARMFALLLAYPTLYLSYLFSGVRQGLAICLFLGLMLPFLLEKKYWQYAAVGIGCILIHKASFILLAAPVVIFLGRKAIFWILSACSVLGVVIGTPAGAELMGKLSAVIGKIDYFSEFSGVSWIALAERLVTFSVIAFVFFKYRKEHDDGNAELVFKLYCCGLGVYMLLCSAPLVASRMMFPLKVTEIVLAGIFIVKMPKWRCPVFLFFAALTAVMTWKNIGSYIEQGNYSCTIANFPYVTVLHDRRTIFAWRDPGDIGFTLEKPKLAKAVGVPEPYWPEEPEETEGLTGPKD